MAENQRIRLTKRMLRESLIAFLAHKNIHHVSVREICEGAEINRTTFYKYYGSPYDLLRDMENEVLAQIEGYLGMNDGLQGDFQLFLKIISYIDDNVELCRLLINNAVGSAFPERLLNLPTIRRLLSEQLSAEYGSDESDYIHQFVVDGGFSIIKRWINRDARESPEKIAMLFVSTLSKLIP
ncbi:MAG TPA: TetR/AcrR family transcriptional regulator C-terminal domain-containing protein [Clostridia bacterium]|nr:TetR/AcrR family transcriptional regulator C-terminal domain-containing protein [Clostridia bacterium]